MKPQLRSILALVVTLVIVGSIGAFWILHLGGRKKSEPQKSEAPASQTKTVKESDLNVITLTPDAERRLGIKIENVISKKVEAWRTLGGEIILPPGKAVTIAAPFAGQIRAPAGKPPAPGSIVTKGQQLLTLLPLLTNEARATMAASLVDAEGQVKNAEVQFKAAGVALARAKQLFADNAGPQRGVDEAQAAFDVAQKTLEAAVARRDLLAKTLRGEDEESVTAITLESPTDGMVRGVFVAPGQLVPSGAPLFEVADQIVAWVRVPVYVGDLDQVVDRPATISHLGTAGGNEGVIAKAVAAPPSATASSATRDLYYELDNKSAVWTPGQRVSVAVPLKSEVESLVIAWSAVVHDINGGAWVYENIAPHQYVRRRVEVRSVVGSQAVLASGPPVGTLILTVGVAELFGREMGFAK